MVIVMVLMAFIGILSPVSARGPTNAGGIKPVEEYGMPLAPYNDNAAWYSGQYIGPDFGWGTETTIVQNGVTIVVDAIPQGTYDEETDEWTETHLMWKANYNAKDYSFSMKFWLNGAGPVAITYYYEDGTTIQDEATDFIFFKSGYVDGIWQDSLQAYK